MHKLKFINSFRFMLSKLSDLINFSEIYSKECRGCKEKKIKSVCNFIGLKIINYIINVTNVKKTVKTNK